MPFDVSPNHAFTPPRLDSFLPGVAGQTQEKLESEIRQALKAAAPGISIASSGPLRAPQSAILNVMKDREADLAKTTTFLIVAQIRNISFFPFVVRSLKPEFYDEAIKKLFIKPLEEPPEALKEGFLYRCAYTIFVNLENVVSSQKNQARSLDRHGDDLEKYASDSQEHLPDSVQSWDVNHIALINDALCFREQYADLACRLARVATKNTKKLIDSESLERKQNSLEETEKFLEEAKKDFEHVEPLSPCEVKELEELKIHSENVKNATTMEFENLIKGNFCPQKPFKYPPDTYEKEQRLRYLEERIKIINGSIVKEKEKAIVDLKEKISYEQATIEFLKRQPDLHEEMLSIISKYESIQSQSEDEYKVVKKPNGEDFLEKKLENQSMEFPRIPYPVNAQKTNYSGFSTLSSRTDDQFLSYSELGQEFFHTKDYIKNLVSK